MPPRGARDAAHGAPDGARGEGWQQCDTVFTNEKAGMGGVDKERVKRVVYELSKGSAHFAQEQRKQRDADARAARLRAELDALTPAALAASERATDARLVELEASRDLTRCWFHVDMDAFFAACEEQADPSLRGIPMAVGGMSMISTANYEARKFGVRSAMPGFIAVRLCPHLRFVKSNFELYRAASAKARAAFARVDPKHDCASLDEAYLDATEFVRGRPWAEGMAELRDMVREATGGLTCSVGAAPNRMLAKIASDINKPNGQFIIEPDAAKIRAFARNLPLRKIPGVGKVTERILSSLGATTCGDVLDRRAALACVLTPVAMSSLLRSSLGLGSTTHSERAPEGLPNRKGMSVERTFKAIYTAAQMEAKLDELAGTLAEHMAREGLRARTLTLKLKTAKFQVRTRAVTLPKFIHEKQDLLAAALRLLTPELPISDGLRLMGVRVSQFHTDAAPGSAAQPTLDQLFGSRNADGRPPAQEGGREPDESPECSDGEGSDREPDGEFSAEMWRMDSSHREAGARDAAQNRATDDAVAEDARRAGTEDAGPGERVKTAWRCAVCTFAENSSREHWCAVCSSYRYANGAASDAGEGAQRRAGGNSAVQRPTPTKQQRGTQRRLDAMLARARGGGVAGARGGEDGPAWVCPECGQGMSVRDRQEHQDMHFARQLREEQISEMQGLGKGGKATEGASRKRARLGGHVHGAVQGGKKSGRAKRSLGGCLER
ncbi:unnamed protein product [Pedinophyceae sp. YPF-701]|nr:unnamed protein product [Pedinophyceae sp. YPF-701]